MRFKNIAACILAVLIAVSLASCGDASNNDGTGTTSSETTNINNSEGLTDEGFFENVKASDYVTLPEYKGVPISPSVFVASDEALKEQIDGILANYTEYEKITDRAIADGDTVNIDYVGKVDGVEFEGGSTKGQGTDVTIGVTQYIDDFLEQLIGHKPGETFDIEVTFPDPYENNTELSGKDAVFTVTINYIKGAPLTTELTDEIASDYGFNTKEELIADIKDWIISRQKAQFFGELMADVECSEIPASVLDYVKNQEIAYFKGEAASTGLDVDSFVSIYTGYDTLDAYIESRAEIFKDTATNYIIVQAIAEKEGLTVTDEDIKAAGFDGYVETFGIGYVKLYLLVNEIVPAFVADNADVTE
jgi:trigger factor